MKKNSSIFVAGGQSGLVGTAIVRRLQSQGYNNIIVKTRKEVDLCNQKSVDTFFSTYKPEYVFLAAAKVGGIGANSSQKADFIYENLEIQSNVIFHAYKYQVTKLLFLGSACIYPRLVKQPIKEEYFMTGPVEPTNDAYAIAKIAGIKMCQSFNEQYKTCFISVTPTNVYGPNDNFDLNNSHVLPALIRKFHTAKVKKVKDVKIWGDGSARREFLYVDDMADACIFLMNSYDKSDFINVGCGNDQSIQKLAEIVKKIVGFTGKISWDISKPNGMPKRQLDVSKLFALGWKPKVSLDDGIKKEYTWFLEHEKEILA